MQYLNIKTVKALELRAPNRSSSDAASLQSRILRGELFRTLNEENRAKIAAKLRNQRDLIPILQSFFENLKYLKAYTRPIKSMLLLPIYKSIFKAMQSLFYKYYQSNGEYIVQEIEQIFNRKIADDSICVALYYRQVFLYTICYYRELSIGSTRIKRKRSDRKRRIISSPDRTVLRKLARLIKQLGFITPQTVKARRTYRDSELIMPILPGRNSEYLNEYFIRRCGCPFDLAYESNK